MKPVPDVHAFHQIAEYALHWYKTCVPKSLLFPKVVVPLLAFIDDYWCQMGLLIGTMYDTYGMTEKGAALQAEHGTTLELLLQLPELSAAYQNGIDAHREQMKQI